MPVELAVELSSLLLCYRQRCRPCQPCEPCFGEGGAVRANVAQVLEEALEEPDLSNLLLCHRQCCRRCEAATSGTVIRLLIWVDRWRSLVKPFLEVFLSQ